MAILVFILYRIGILQDYGVKHIQFSYFLSIALDIGQLVFYILGYIYLLNRFPFTQFSFPMTMLGLPLSNATN